MQTTRILAQSELFRAPCEHLSTNARVSLTYARAQAIGRAYGLTRTDLLTLSRKFWELHSDPIMVMDAAAATLCTIQYNLSAGTLIRYATRRTDFDQIIEKILRFEVIGQYCMTELDHGLDIINMETTATMMSNGEWDLHTPHDRAAKYMPPTSPVGIPCVAVVYARAMVNGAFHGIKPFFVPLHDGVKPYTGITIVQLAPRGGSHPINHSLTSFRHVRLPSTAVLVSPKKPRDDKMAFFESSAHVHIGTLALPSMALASLKLAGVVGFLYSQKRKIVEHHSGRMQPILSFQSQKIPVMTALAQAVVLDPFRDWSIRTFMSTSDPAVRQSIAAIAKVIINTLTHSGLLAVGDRCGAQGLFEVNQLSVCFNDLRGQAIAEGDILALSIRIAAELLRGKCSLPESTNPSSLLAEREVGLFAELRDAMHSMRTHRSDAYNRLVLPRSLELLEAIGARMAFDAAVTKGVHATVLDLFVASIVKRESAWFAEKAGLSRATQHNMEADAIDALYPRLPQIVEELDMAPYVSAPILSNDAWRQYVSTLKTFTGPSPIRPVTYVSPPAMSAKL